MAELPSPIFEANKFWAIQLSDTERRFWQNEDDFSVLSYKWDDIEVAGNSAYNRIAVAVAKVHPNYNDKRIFDIATGIHSFSRLKPGDGILGVSGNKLVKKAGVISHNILSETPNSVKVNIKWFNEIKPTEAESPIFDESLEIQKMTQQSLSNLTLPVMLRGGSLDKLMSTSELKMINPYLNLRLLDELEQEIIPKEDKGGKISLFYGTNRNKTDSDDPNDFYGDGLSELKFGKCEVNIPRGHAQGEVERPKKIWRIEFPESEQRHIVVKGIGEMDEQVFFSELTKDMNEAGEKSALIFIHGYNNTFAEAARRTAQIAWDVPFNGISGFYSWPSCGRTFSYPKDIEHADASIPFLESFIEKIVHETEIEKLHLIAHSMGNRLLTFTLNNLSGKASFSQKLNIIQQIVLAAPDIDQNVFRNTILPKFQNVGLRRTLYSSDKDKALHFAERLRGGLPRLGDAGTSLFVDYGLDTVDASNVNSRGNNHSYIFDTKELLSDLYYLLNKDFSPIDRRLQARIKNTLTYWLFPK